MKFCNVLLLHFLLALGVVASYVKSTKLIAREANPPRKLDFDKITAPHRRRSSQSAPIPEVPDLSDEELASNDLSKAVTEPNDPKHPTDDGEPPSDDQFFNDLLDDIYNGPPPEDQPVSIDEYTNSDGRQKPLKEISSNAREALWKRAFAEGERLRGILDKYVSSNTRRIDSLPAGQRPLPMDQNYEVKYVGDLDLEAAYDDIEEPLTESGVRPSSLGDSDDWQAGFVSSKTRGSANPKDRLEHVLQVGIDVVGGVIVSLSAFAKLDYNPKEKRLRSSELTWQIWENVARMRAYSFEIPPDQAVRGLRYILRHDIVNQQTFYAFSPGPHRLGEAKVPATQKTSHHDEQAVLTKATQSVNLMTLAHSVGQTLKNPDGTPCVRDIPNSKDGTPLPPSAGHGLWKPDNPIYDALLSSPNVKPIVHMLADHNTEIDNPYITEIHTMPSISRSLGGLDRIKDGESRVATMVIVLGRYPGDSSSKPPIETS